MSEIDKAEYQRIEAAIRAAEQALAENPHIRQDSALASLEPSKKRLEHLEQQGIVSNHSDKSSSKRVYDVVAVAALVAKETALSHEERQTYAGFLRQDYFTRSNFDELEVFYSDGWERLSESGKREMSDRFWAGVERGEYTVQDSPDAIRRRELDQLAFYLENPEKAPPRIQNLSPEVRDEFLREYRAGNIAQAEEILSDRDLFVKQPKGVSQPDSVRSAESGAPLAQNFESGVTPIESMPDQSKSDLEGLSYNENSLLSPAELPSTNTGRSIE